MKSNAAAPAIRWTVIMLAFAMIPGPAPAGEVGYSAIVMDVKDRAFVSHAGVRKAIDLGSLLYPGDSVETAPGASLMIAYLESGQEETWPGGAKFVVEKSGSRPAPAQIRQRNRINLPQIAAPQKGSFTFKGIQEDFELEVGSLSNTRTIEDRPVFRWSPYPLARRYVVRLYPASKNEPLWQKTTNAESLPFPSDAAPLNPGDGYKWVVEAWDGGSVLAKKTSCFSLPPVAEWAEIKKEAASYQAPLEAGASDPTTRFRYILFLEEHRLYDEALKQYGLLQRQHGESESLKDMRMKIIELRSLPCQAY